MEAPVPHLLSSRALVGAIGEEVLGLDVVGHRVQQLPPRGATGRLRLKHG